MKERPLGRSPLNVSVVGLGGNNFGRRLDLAGTRRVVDAALDAGINFIDSADIYGSGESERFLGEVLAGRRDRVVLATKFGMDMGADAPAEGPRGAPRYVRASAEASLARLNTDRIDLLYYHRPDGETPLEETLDAMHELVTEGKVVALGCSNLDAAQLREAVAHTQSTGITPVAALQNEHNLLKREAEREILPLCAELDVGFVPYFPLASGLLTGKFRRGQPPPVGTRIAPGDPRLSEDALDEIDRLAGLAERHGHSLLEIAIASLVWRPGVASVIAGAMSAEQVRANAAAADWEPGPEVWADLDAV